MQFMLTHAQSNTHNVSSSIEVVYGEITITKSPVLTNLLIARLNLKNFTHKFNTLRDFSFHQTTKILPMEFNMHMGIKFRSA